MPMGEGPIREGNRGGLGDFRWSNVVNDKHRDNYLGATVNAPQGRWQKNQDIHWYTRDAPETDADKAAKAKRAEMKALKDAEEEALSVALGFAPKKPVDGEGTGANGVPVKKSARDEEIERLEKEEKKRDKALRKELRALKRAEKEIRREDRERDRDDRRARRRYDDDDRRRDRDRDRSRSYTPDRRERDRRRDRSEERYRDRSRSRSVERERYRERDRGDRDRRRGGDRSRSRERAMRRDEEREKRWKGSSTPPMRTAGGPSPGVKDEVKVEVKEERNWVVDDDA